MEELSKKLIDKFREYAKVISSGFWVSNEDTTIKAATRCARIAQEHADQQVKKMAIAFAEWCENNYLASFSNFKLNHWRNYTKSSDTTRYTTEQLYESEEFKQYMEQQNKENNFKEDERSDMWHPQT